MMGDVSWSQDESGNLTVSNKFDVTLSLDESTKVALDLIEGKPYVTLANGDAKVTLVIETNEGQTELTKALLNGIAMRRGSSARVEDFPQFRKDTDND